MFAVRLVIHISTRDRLLNKTDVTLLKRKGKNNAYFVASGDIIQSDSKIIFDCLEDVLHRLQLLPNASILEHAGTLCS